MPPGKKCALSKKAAAISIAAASAEASSTAVGTGAGTGAIGAGDGPQIKNSIMVPTTVLEECSAAGLRQVQSTAQNARLAFRGVPSFLGVAVIVWDQTKDLM